jgi:PadR family transcriptional regulator, regulatory protein PadR
MQQSELIKGTLSTLILQLLEEQGRLHGYEIARQIKERSGGKILVKEGSLYPALHRLQADGLLQVEEEAMGKRIRRYYRLTPSGKSRLILALDDLRAFLSMLGSMIEPKTHHAV